MKKITPSDEVDPCRRNLLGAVAATLAAFPLGVATLADAQQGPAGSKGQAPAKSSAHASFAAIKQINAGVLSVGYAEAGPADGPPVLLLHGWPYDIYSFVDVTPLLVAAGYRVIVPFLRGYGSTRFLSTATVRNGQPSALAADIVALMDALKIEKATLGGFDWGARTANIIAALWPARCKAMVSVQRLSDRQPASRQGALATQSRASMVVPVLLRHGARPRRL